jgi:DNA sulfur modification protein DndB
MSDSVIDTEKLAATESPQIKIECTRGIQSGREFYTAMIPLALVGRLLSDGTDAAELPPEMRQQRKTNPSRAKRIAKYLHENTRDDLRPAAPRRNYVLPALTVSINASPNFQTFEGSHYVGFLTLDAGTEFLVNDGLHRRAGIVEALRRLNGRERRKMTKPQIAAHERRVAALKSESIPVTFYVSAGLAQAQQMFVDINRNASKPNTALSMTFDHRDQFNTLARQVAAEVFPGRVEFERATAGEGKLFSINALVAAVKTVADAWYTDEPVAAELVAFFRHLEKSMSKEWKRGTPLVEVFGGAAGDPPPPRMSTQNIALEAIAIALAQQENWKTLAKRLTGLDWSRDAAQWSECFVVVDGRIAKNKRSTDAMGCSILRSLRTAAKPRKRSTKK